MRSRVLGAAVLGGLVLTAAVLALQTPMAVESQSARAIGLGAELRYVGRDPLTGMPARVDDRFIAEAERAIERYGKDAGDPIAAPAPGHVDIASISIERLGLRETPVGRYGLDAYGRLDVPQDAATVGWNPAYNALPGEGGATFFAAHFEYAGRPGVFYRLSTVTAGDTVEVVLSDGSRHRYRVSSTIEYALGTIDMGALLHGREGSESITLMTCSGPANEGEYAFRTVVLAERVE